MQLRDGLPWPAHAIADTVIFKDFCYDRATWFRGTNTATRTARRFKIWCSADVLVESGEICIIKKHEKADPTHRLSRLST